MLGIILKILSALGILFLILLGLLFLLLLFVLFYPITYQAQGKKDCDSFRVSAKANWLFGILRFRYAYPEPGKITVKVLWHTLFASGNSKVEPETQSGSPAEPVKENKAVSAGSSANEESKLDRSVSEPGENTGDSSENINEEEQHASKDQDAEIKYGNFFLSKKIEKIQYTIRNIYDKIKEIWKNITYYTEILKAEETKQLFSHICFRLGKIWKHIHPRHLRADALFGTGSPDTTGYLFGIYGMVSPTLGTSVNVTPDFNEKILEGSFYVSGHITVFILVINALKVLLDKNLMHFIQKWKARRN